MKKKLLLLTVLAMALVCLLALSVSADSVNPSTSDAYGTLTTFDDAIGNTQISNLKNDGTIARAVITDGNGNYYTVPTVYLLTEHSKNRGDVQGEMFNLSFTEISSKIGFTVSKNSIIRIELPADIAFICRNDETLSGCANMVECVISDGLRFWENSSNLKVFTGCSKLKSIDLSGMIIDYNNSTFAMFEYCPELEYVKLPDAYYDASTGVYLDYNTCHMFSGCNKLKTIENYKGFFKGDKVLSYKTFYNCYVLHNIVLWDGLETIEGRAFGNCKAITEFIIPDTVTEIGTNETVFESCTSLKKVVFPSGAVSVGAYAFEKCTALTDVWMPGAGSTFAGQVFGQCGSSLAVNFYFTTATSTITVSNTTNNKDPYITAINATSDARLKFNTPLSTKCTVFLGGHHASASTNDCTKDITCKDCQIVLVTAQDGHDIVVTIVYNDGFASVGVKTTDCTREGCTVCDKTEEAPVIITAKGYSYKEEGNGISGGFEINTTALNAYKEANPGKSVVISLLIVNPDYLDTSASFFNANGESTATKGVIQVDISNTAYAKLDYMVSGFTLQYMQELELAFAIVVKVDNKVEVVQKQYAPEEVSAVKATYTDVAGIKLASVTVESIAPEIVDALKKEQEQA